MGARIPCNNDTPLEDLARFNYLDLVNGHLRLIDIEAS